MIIYFSHSLTSDEEMKAQDLIKRGEIDQAIAIYQQIETKSARVFFSVGILYADERGSYELAISCFEQALRMQEQVCGLVLMMNEEIEQ